MRNWIIAAMLSGLAASASAQTSLQEFQSQTGGSAQEPALNCAVRPSAVVEVASLVNGVVAEVLVTPGDTVTPGAPLVRLNDVALQSELAVAQARAAATAGLASALTRLRGAETREMRLARGLERGAVTQADYDDAALSLAIARDDVAREEELIELAALEVTRIENQLSVMTIRALVTGVLGEDIIAPGEGTQTRPIGTIFVNDPLRVEVFVPAAQLNDVVAIDGPYVQVDGENGSSRDVPVTFDYASQVADVASNTISVYFTLDDPGVRPGVRCRMPITSQE